MTGMFLPRIDVNHLSKASFNFSHAPVFILRRFSDEFWKALKIFSLFFFQVARLLLLLLPSIKITTITTSKYQDYYKNTELVRKIFIRPSSFNASYFTFKVTSWCILFVVTFIASATNKSNSDKFKDYKTFEYYGIQSEAFELTTVEYWRMKKLDSKTKVWITWWKIHPGDPNVCSI